METLVLLIEALGLVLGSFIVAIGLSGAGWAIFVRAHHPEVGALAIAFCLLAALATRVLVGQFFSMVTILMVVAAPLMWVEGCAWRRRKKLSQASQLFPRKFW